MANPLMPAILNNTLARMGKKSDRATAVMEAAETAAQPVNLNRAQESLLKDYVLKPAKASPSGSYTGYAIQQPTNGMVTLESLRKKNKEDNSAPANAKSRETGEKSLVSLASIGKLYKK